MESLSRPPRRRKHSSTNSFSFKNPYEGVFLFNGGERGSLEAHEYAEIFSGASSIPVLDLSGLDERVGSGDFRSSKLDYSNIFGGFRNDDVAMPYEELFCGSAKKNKLRNPTDARESGSLHSSEKPKRSSGQASDESVDGVKKQFNMSFNRTSQKNTDTSNGKTHIAQLQAVPGFTYFVDGTPRLQKMEDSKTVNSLKREVSRTWSFSAEVETAKGKGGLNCDKSHISDMSHNANDVNLKSNLSKVSPLSSCPSYISGNKDPKQSRASEFVSKRDASEKIVGEFAPPYFGEDFDENSVAAASAAALKKAIDQAQESIRLAKMIMNRKKEGYQNGSKPRQKGSPRVSVKEGKIDRDSYGSKKNNSKEKYEGLDPTFIKFDGIDEKFTPSRSHNDTFINAARIKVERVCGNVAAATAKEHGTDFSGGGKLLSSSGSQRGSLYINEKVDLEKTGERVEAAETHSEEADFPVLVANECKTANLVSDKMDNSNSLLPSTSKLACHKDNLEQREVPVYHTKGPEVVAEVVGRARDTSQRMQEMETSVEEAEQRRASFDHVEGPEHKVERVLNTSHRTQEQEKILGGFGKNLRISQEDEVPEERENDMDDMGKQELEEMLKLEHFTVWRSELDNFLNELCNTNLGKNETLGLVETERKSEIVSERKENGETYDDEAHLWFESEEQLKEALEEEINETEPGAFEIGEVESSFNELEIDNQKRDHASDGDVPKLHGELKQNKVEERHMNTSVMGASNCTTESEVQKSVVFYDFEETNYTLEGAGRIEENCNNRQYEEDAYEEHIDEAFNVNSSSASTIFSEAQTADASTNDNEAREACNVDLDNKSHGYHRVTENCKADDNVSEVIETFYAIDKDKEAEHLFHLEDDNEIPGTETIYRIASEENFVESKLHNDFDSLSSDGQMENVCVLGADPEEELSEDDNASSTSSEIHDVAQECTSEINRQSLPRVRASDIRTAEFEVSELTSESDEGSVSASSHENINGFSAVDSEECAENANDMTPNNEELKDELELVSNERKFSKEQSELKEMEKPMETGRAVERGLNTGNNNENFIGNSPMEKKDAKGGPQNSDNKDYQQRVEAIKRGREREKDRIVVERAIREARERAFAEARERAERAAVERAAAEARQRAMAEAQEKLEKASHVKQTVDKTSTGSKLRAERAAVERATAEARERALEKAMSQKTTYTEGKTTETFSGGSSRHNGLKHSFSSSDLENGIESAQRRKARLERHQRIMERAAKALAEKNMRDLLVQKEQAERNRLAESLDADIKRWATGKEGNLRALLSTLQYILGPNSGWHPIPLTEIITSAAVKKAYRKATLYVHPDKLQQRGASIQQKYLCEKVFDLLKAAWNRFNSDER